MIRRANLAGALLVYAECSCEGLLFFNASHRLGHQISVGQKNQRRRRETT